jgi:hypothetical protein
LLRLLLHLLLLLLLLGLLGEVRLARRSGLYGQVRK